MYFLYFWGSDIEKAFQFEMLCFQRHQGQLWSYVSINYVALSFSEGTLRRLGQLVISLSKKMIELQKEKNKEADSIIDYL